MEESKGFSGASILESKRRVRLALERRDGFAGPRSTFGAKMDEIGALRWGLLRVCMLFFKGERTSSNLSHGLGDHVGLHWLCWG